MGIRYHSRVQQESKDEILEGHSCKYATEEYFHPEDMKT
jgi:hypothetical protein